MNLRVFVSTFVVSMSLIALISGCTLPLNTATIPQPSASSDTTATTETEAAPAESSATATVATRSLRVRQMPNESSEVVAGIAAGETYRVIGLSDDGQWVQLAIESAPEGNGWVSANFVTVEGEITGLAVGSESATTITNTTESTTSVAVEATPALTLVPTPQPGFARVSTEGIRLRVRSEPTADAPIVGYAYDGETYQVIATSGDGLWVQIPPATGSNSDNPEGGWVAAEFLIIGQ
ncbi:MAG: SH3 domain-containing protein [Caldilineaceae bacterium]|nr:SH3 domain-containing protein [Caldilineaceae bacterium]